ncbi:cyclase family protein [Treponema socranskii]|uniref:Cyclase n=1 Tax=Treponema socranskii subsp. socranskii VPI DR56BR1116 = ATCC 35536 TaxID=1125725 RepID=U1FJC6_TRESO|nr:cyclase family protein [Treponema socranskii]ERF59868.1 putative cyclase [Treponema socranskii subsp. socranskii VPI DR56BR1116 = ATCC 35536]ERK03372.1 putative cyclase [Treponema socranskii subsp. socranskii VPI DR56BR1116 = ATCC 35536]MDR9859922.1 cyclase family protein [Treponema socranskii]
MLIDLTWPIEKHWRYGKFYREEIQSFEKGNLWQVTGFYLGSHWFSHMDFPRHTGAQYPDSSAFSLDYYNGAASILNLTKTSVENYGFTSEDLKYACKKTGKLEKILLLRSDWGLECSHMEKEFWTKAPYLTDDAIDWLQGQDINAVAFDFPQDYSIRLLIERPVGPEEQKTHTLLLRNNILLIEYLCNFNSIPSDRCEFFCLPLKLDRIDGCPVRAVARV